jgi:outer membrane immunogenic protein
MIRILWGAVVALLLSGSAFGQSASYDWTGFYVGANGGYGWGTDGGVDFKYLPACVPAFSGDCPSSLSMDIQGPLGGGQLGANWQHDMWVLGIEGDADISGIDGSGHKSTSFSGTTKITASTDLSWLATLRGRVGVTNDRALVYATGGVAFGGLDNKAKLTSGSTAIGGLGGTWKGAKDDVQVGWTAGGGFEYAATQHIVIGVEALYVDLGDRSVKLKKTPAVTTPVISADFQNQFVVARGRISFKW